MRLKNCVLRPLLYVLGLPHNTHHQSVFIESRLLDMQSLHALTSARLAHRWLSLDDTNEAAVMFRDHLTRYGTGDACAAYPKHPFARLCAAVHDTPLCFIGPAKPAFFLMPKTAMRHTIWAHQYQQWESDGVSNGMRVPAQSPSAGFHSLNRLYPYQVKYVTSKVPMYTHYDTPATAAHRARFRFCRARLKLNMHRLRFADADDPVCSHCTFGEDESVEHVVLYCPAYAIPRQALIVSMRVVLKRQLRYHELEALVLDPQYSVKKEQLRRVMEITGKFINEVTAIRKC
jgi:hypothetical protein